MQMDDLGIGWLSFGRNGPTVYNLADMTLTSVGGAEGSLYGELQPDPRRRVRLNS